MKIEFGVAEELGIRLCCVRGSIDLTKEEGGNIPEGLVQTIDEILSESEDAIINFHDGNINSMRNVILGPCSPFCCSKELMKKTVELARKNNVKMHTHLCETKDEENWTLEKYNKRPLELMREVGLIGEDVFYAHGIHFTDEEIKILADTKTSVSHCPISNMKLSSGIMKMKEMRKFGVNIGLGVDGSASNDGSNMLEEMRVCFLLHRLNESHEAPNGYDILKIATRGGAKLIGRNELGQLNIDKACDLFMIDKNRIEMVGCDYDFKSYLCTVGHKGHVDMTIVNGNIVFKDGKLVNIDEEKVIPKAKEIEEKYLHGNK
jgi:cytosine/adenosine deaminase-related metal-dependent hydrolase